MTWAVQARMVYHAQSEALAWTDESVNCILPENT